jgi:hypothetical protein
MAVLCNRLDENKGTFGPFVAGQKDKENRILHADSQYTKFKNPKSNSRYYCCFFHEHIFYTSHSLVSSRRRRFLSIRINRESRDNRELFPQL